VQGDADRRTPPKLDPLSNPEQPTAVLEKVMQPPTSSAESRRAVPAATSMLVFALVLALLMFAFWT